MKILDVSWFGGCKELELGFFKQEGDKHYKFLVYVYPTFSEFHFGKDEKSLRFFWIGNIAIEY